MWEFELVGELSGFKDGANTVSEWQIQRRSTQIDRTLHCCCEDWILKIAL